MSRSKSDSTSQTMVRIRAHIKRHFQSEAKKPFVPGKTRIPLTVPTYDGKEVEESLESLLSTWVSMGKKVKRFEEMFADYLGSKHAVMVNSGSSANLLAMSVLTNPTLHERIEPGSEVITPAVTWATTVYPIANVGCVPVLVDVDIETYNINIDELERAINPRTKAVVAVHLLGSPCRIDKALDLAQKNDLFLVEDTCESTGAEFHGKKVGTFGDMGTFSFYMSHHISTIEGGMIVTDNDDYFEYLKAMRAFGWIRDLKDGKKISEENPQIDPRFLFVTYGYNLRPTEIQGAFGIHQIKKLDSFVGTRRRNAQYWNKKLEHYKDIVILPSEELGSKHVYFGFPLTLRESAPFQREEMVSYLERRGIETRPIMAGNMFEQPVMKHLKHRAVGELKNSKLIMRRSFFFGNHNGIGTEEREFVAECLVDFMNSASKR